MSVIKPGQKFLVGGISEVWTGFPQKVPE